MINSSYLFILVHDLPRWGEDPRALFTLRASRRGHSDVDAHVWPDVPESDGTLRKVPYAATQLARTTFSVLRRAGASGI